MKSILRTALMLGLAVVVFKGCIFSSKVEDPIISTGQYLEPTSPENLVNNLEESYVRQEIEEYAKLLAPEYIFKVQPVDVAEFGETFSRDRDSSGTAGLFDTPLVSDIRIILTHGAATVPTEIEFAPGTLKIRIQPTFLEVDETTGITWQVDGDIQDLFFRDLNDGVAPAHWVIIEWRDIPGAQTAPRIRNDALGSGTAAVRSRTWGSLRARLGEETS